MSTIWNGKDEQTREQERAIWYLFSAVVAVLFFITGLGAGARWFGDSQSRIGDHNVPSNLRCEEDEVIGFHQVGAPPYELGCVHVDSFGN